MSGPGSRRYGYHEQVIQKAVEDGVDTIVTCDNGIAAPQKLRCKSTWTYRCDYGHHDIPFRETSDGKEWIIPVADAVINPKQTDCGYPNKNLCGAVVAWKLIWALYEKSGISQSEVLEFTELAAVATVGDVMDLQGENRIIVKEGLRPAFRDTYAGTSCTHSCKSAGGSGNYGISCRICSWSVHNASGRLDHSCKITGTSV